MRANKEEEGEECFVAEQFQEVSQTEPVQLKVEISKKINEQMPANQLRATLRPDNMAPRTFYLERPLYLLKEALNEPQYEVITQVSAVRQKLRIKNSQNLNIQAYFSRNKFRCIYNKLATTRHDCRSFLGRLKSVDTLIDYNWKSFKELEIEADLFGDHPVDDLRVDSDFQGGNICRAYLSVESSEKQYFMLIENDLNTYGYNNWFFFRVKNNQQGTRGFSIVNLIKKTNFFTQGMLISVFSAKKHQEIGQGWFKGGQNITFGPVNLTRQHHDNENYYTLYFEHNFIYDNDEVYFALSQPYTYSRLIHFLENTKSPTPSIKMEVKPIGYTITNNIIPVVRIYNQKVQRENAILFIARQHPCQTVGSFIAQKLMKYLISQSPISAFLSKKFEIYVIPMVNPDGVIHGMSRTNMAGLDLNRHWGDNILKELTPQTMKVKAYISNLTKTKRIRYMIDLHGHGKRLNSFFFCCKGTEKDGNQMLTLCMKELQQRFNIYGCTFGITKDKENTLRSLMFGMGIKNSYTLQTSLFGWKNDQGQPAHFNQADYESIAANLAKSIFLLQSDAESTQNELGIVKDLIVKQLPLISQIRQREEKLVLQSSQIMSDSDPQGDKLDVKQLLAKCQNKIIKKKLQESYIAIKKNFAKKYKKLSAVEANHSFKNLSLRQSYAPSLNNTFHHPIAQSNRNPTKNPQKNDNMQTTQQAINKPIKAIKVHQKTKESQLDKRKQIIDSLNLTRTKIRARIRIQTYTSQGKQVKIFHKNPSRLKNEQPIFLLKTEKVSIKTEPDEFVAHKLNQKQLRFEQLKKESISMMLNDTISIFKFRKERQKSASRINQVKNVSLQAKKQSVTSQGFRQHPISVLDADAIFSKARNIQQLMHGKSAQSSKFRCLNSVYYHYPVL